MLSASNNNASNYSNNKRPREDGKITLRDDNNHASKSLKDESVDSLNAEIQALQKQLAQSEETRQSEANSYRTQLAENAAQIKSLKQHAETKAEEYSNTFKIIQELKHKVAEIEAKNINVEYYERCIANLMQQNSDFYWTLRNYLYAHSTPQPQINLPPLLTSNIPLSMYPPMPTMMPMPIPSVVPLEPPRNPMQTDQFKNMYLPGNYNFFPQQYNSHTANHANTLPQVQDVARETTNAKK